MSIQTVEITLPNGIAHVVEVRQGPAGATGATGPAGPNSVTSATTSDGTANLSLAAASVTNTLTAKHIHGNLAGSIYLHVRAGEALSKGDPVYVSGSHGTGSAMVPIVMRADASNAAKMPAIAIMDAAVANNGDGHAVINGTITDLNTQAYAINSTLYVANGGGMTATKPANAQPVARVERSNLNNGGIVVKVNGLYSDVTIASSQVTDATSSATAGTIVKRNGGGSAAFGSVTVDSFDPDATASLVVLGGSSAFLRMTDLSGNSIFSFQSNATPASPNFYTLPDATGTVILDTTLGAGVNGLSTITGAKSFSGQVSLTGQAATDDNSAMTRGLADARYSHAIADFDYSSNTVGASGGSGVWTWTPPATAKLLRITCVAGGSGGGSGRCGASGSDRSGGGGGSSGPITIVDMPTSFLSGGALTITVGAGGAGGAAITSNDTNGADGATGADTTVADGSTTIAVAANNSSSVPRGKGGSTTSGAAGTTSYSFWGIYSPTTGAAGSNTSGTAKPVTSFSDGGAGGGGLNTSNAIGRGGINGTSRAGNIWGQISLASQSISPVAGVDGGSGTTGSIDSRVPVGASGVGGNGGLTVKGGNGTAGVRGGGGGGGGAGTNGTGGSGAGGAGGNGFVRIEIIN